MRPQLFCFFALVLLCSFSALPNRPFSIVYTGNDTLPVVTKKTVSSVRYKDETKEYHVRYTDGTTETMNRHTLDERGIYFPGSTPPADTTAALLYEKESSVDTALWRNHLAKHLPEYLKYAERRGLPRGTYTVNVRFLVNKDGSLSNFSVTPNPGYRFLEFVEVILKNGPKWQPAEQNGKKLRSYHTQPITLRISNHFDSE